MQNTERRYMKVIYDEQGNIYYQMMDVALDVDGDKIEPIYIDRPLTDTEKLLEKITQIEGEITDNQLALAELSTEK